MDPQNEEPQKKAKPRSPSYPAIDLETAIARASDLWQKEHMNSAATSVILGHWGYTPKSGNGLLTLAALIKFGLLTTEGSGNDRKARLTELARKIILDDRPNSPERDIAIREAALNPIIHKELWGKYKSELPSDDNLRHELRYNEGFTDSGAVECIRELRGTWAYVKLAESATMPEEGKDKPSSEVEVGDETKGIPTSPNKAVFIISGGSTSVRLEAPLPMSKARWEQITKTIETIKDDFVERTPG